MQLQIDRPKNKIIMLRVSEEMQQKIGRIAKKNKTSQSKVCRALIEQGLHYGKTNV